MKLRERAFVLVVSASLIGAGIAAPVSASGSASPAINSVDCGQDNGVSSTTVTGRVGDTFSIDNTAGANSCTFAGYAGIATATNLDVNNKLSAGQVSTLTIVAAGSFTVTPGSASPTAGTFTVVIGDPNPTPEYTITFDANGGTCGPNAQSVTAASGQWYALPTNGTGPGQCYREDYILTGWSHGSTILQPGSEEFAPDIPVPAPGPTPFVPIPGSLQSNTAAEQAMPTSSVAKTGKTSGQIADHATLFAVWTPGGVALTYDANVAANDPCVDTAGVNVTNIEDRSSEYEVYFAGGSDTIATEAPCTPVDAAGVPLPLQGWALSGDGPVIYGPGIDLTMTKFAAGTHDTLYAQWGAPPTVSGRFGDENFAFSYYVDEERLELVISMEMVRTPQAWAGLAFHNFMFPADSLIVSFNPTNADGQLQYFDGYNPGIPTLSFFPSPAPDNDPIFISYPSSPFNNQENWSGIDTSEESGIRTIQLTRKLITNDIFDLQFKINGIYPVCWAYNLELGFNTSDFDAMQPTHSKYGCTQISLNLGI